MTLLKYSLLLLILYSCKGGNEGDNVPVADSASAKTTITESEVTQTSKNYFGIDISKYQGNEIVEIGPEDSLTFIICKATEGINYTDPDFETNMSTIKSKNLIAGVYHFYHTSDDPAHQAGYFWNAVSRFKDEIGIAPVVDIEQGSLPNNSKADATKIQADLKTFLNELEKLSGRKPMIYTGYSFGSQYLTDTSFAAYNLWLAEYTGAAEPKIPSTWKDRGYKIWQKQDNYTINSTQNDFDVYYGTKAGLTQ